MVPQEKFGCFIGTKGGSDFGIKDSEGSESEEQWASCNRLQPLDLSFAVGRWKPVLV